MQRGEDESIVVELVDGLLARIVGGCRSCGNGVRRGLKTREQQRLTECRERDCIARIRELRVGENLIDSLRGECVVGHGRQHCASAGDCRALILEVKVGVDLRGVGFAEERPGIVCRVDVARRGLDDDRPRLPERAELGEIDEKSPPKSSGWRRPAVCGGAGDRNLERRYLGVGPVRHLGAGGLERLHGVAVGGLGREFRGSCWRGRLREKRRETGGGDEGEKQRPSRAGPRAAQKG